MSFKSKFLGTIAYLLTFLLRKSLRVVIVKPAEYNPTQQYLCAFWHGKQLLPVLELRKMHQTKEAVLVSSSRDGDLLVVWLKKLGYEIIRGSSRHRNISALADMRRKLKEGYSVGFGIDGPIGPIYKVKPGMTHMAQKCGISIVPVGTAFSRKWVFNKAWDKYEIPKPFAKAVLYVGKPFYIGEGANLEECNLRLEQYIAEAEVKAANLL